MKKTMIMLCLALVSWGVNAQHNHATHDTQKQEETTGPVFKNKDLGTAYNQYIHLKDALVASDLSRAKQVSAELVKSLHVLEGAGKAHLEAGKVASAATLDAQRKAFAVLSNEMASLLKDSEFSGGEFYLAYCPMANDHTGAYWLSSQKEIRNPYFGDKMLHCGSVKETIR